jgi:hypothetical protein
MQPSRVASPTMLNYFMMQNYDYSFANEFFVQKACNILFGHPGFGSFRAIGGQVVYIAS